jgi:hypothetical protein
VSLRKTWGTLKKLDEANITARAVEISKCLVGTAPGMFTHDLGATRDVGDAARLAVSIRRAGEIISREAMAAVSSALKIDSRLVETNILPLFEELAWVEVKREGKRIENVIERIPPVEDLLPALGKAWRERQPTPVDEASLNALSSLSRRPYTREALLSELDVDEATFKTTVDYGEQARYLGTFMSQEYEAETIWTPLYWASNSEKVQEFLKRRKERDYESIADLAEELRKYPGRPKQHIDQSKFSASMLDGGIWHGLFPTGGVTDRQGNPHVYVFAPAPQFDTDPKSDIFEKARMIVSCIRHGQYDAEVTRILYPTSILQAMRTNSMKPHPYADVQYAILVHNGIIKLEPDSTRYGKAWRTIFIDSAENNAAADAAAQMLRGEQPFATSKEDAEARKILTQGMYTYSSEQRRLSAAKKIAAKQEFDRLLELIGTIGK